MTGLEIFLSTAVVGGVSYVLVDRYIVRVYKEKFQYHKAYLMERSSNTQLEAINRNLMEENRDMRSLLNAQFEVKTELKEGWKGAAGEKAYEKLFEALPQILQKTLGQVPDAYANVYKENFAKLAELSELKARQLVEENSMEELIHSLNIARTNNDQLIENNDKIRKDNERLRRELELERSHRERSDMRYEQLKIAENSLDHVVNHPDETIMEIRLPNEESGGVLHAITPFPEASAELHADVLIQLESELDSSENGITLKRDGIWSGNKLDFIVGHSTRYLLKPEIDTQSEEQTGVIQIIERSTRRHIKSFNVTSLHPGITHSVPGTDAMVVKCGLPSCNKIKVARTASDRFCCSSHRFAYHNIEKKKLKERSDAMKKIMNDRES